jgi:exopolysaccharide biosynthesis protein
MRKGMLEGRSTWPVERAHVRLFRVPGAMKLVVCLALLSLPSPNLTPRSYSAVQNQQAGKQESGNQEFQNVGRGIEHLRIIRGHKSESEVTGPWVINVLRIDLKEVDCRIAHALDEGVGLETTSSIASRYGASAAVNAGFFRTTGTYRGESSGVLVLEGELISEPIEGRAAFGFIKSLAGAEIVFGHLKFSGYVESVRGRRLATSGLNRPRAADELIAYTPEFHRTTLTTPDGVEAIVRRTRIIRIRDGEGSSAIPPNGFVISACGSAREWVLANLRVGAIVRLSSKLVPVEREMTDSWKRASFIVGGGPQLIKASRVAIPFEDEKIAAKFVSDRHPRTAIARLKDGRMLVATVDGRQPGVSAGMSLPELADLLLEFGASEAINLDGGGSTTMVVNGRLVNNPSDQTGERPVSDAILMLPRRLQQKDRVH